MNVMCEENELRGVLSRTLTHKTLNGLIATRINYTNLGSHEDTQYDR